MYSSAIASKVSTIIPYEYFTINNFFNPFSKVTTTIYQKYLNMFHTLQDKITPNIFYLNILHYELISINKIKQRLTITLTN